MKDDLIAVLSHELRTPLNAMLGWTHVLKKRGGTDELVRGLGAIERNGYIQARMISDILDMSRLNSGKMPLTLEMVDPAEVVVAAVNAMRASMEQNDQAVVFDMEPPFRRILADSSRLQQVIWNLLSNAVKFSPPGSRIQVGLREDDRGLELRITDQGQGLEEDFLPYLFDRFTQSDATSNRSRGGLGLGLSIVKQLVEAHGGTVSASSPGPGRGSTFEIWLPADWKPSAEAPAMGESAFADLHDTEDTEGPLDGMQVLIVDDDREACAMLRIILTDRGATVRAAHDFDEALAVLALWAPDAVISDVGMPGKDGYELIRAIREREADQGRHVAAIALTSFTRDQDRAQALAAGFDAHCAKPLRPLHLVRQMRRLVGGRFRDSK